MHDAMNSTNLGISSVKRTQAALSPQTSAPVQPA